MVGSHLAHEGRVGNKVVFSNGVQVGGCVTIGNNVIIGGLSAVHQFTRIGDHAFVGGMACVTTDVIPERLEDVSRLYANHEQVMEIVSFIQQSEKRPICMPHTGL